MNQYVIPKEKKTWFKIIKNGIVLNCAALMIGGGLMIASPCMGASFTIGTGVTENNPQVLKDDEMGIVANEAVEKPTKVSTSETPNFVFVKMTTRSSSVNFNSPNNP